MVKRSQQRGKSRSDRDSGTNKTGGRPCCSRRGVSSRASTAARGGDRDDTGYRRGSSVRCGDQRDAADRQGVLILRVSAVLNTVSIRAYRSSSRLSLPVYWSCVSCCARQSPLKTTDVTPSSVVV